MVPFLYIAVRNPHVAASVNHMTGWLADAKFENYKLLKTGTIFLFIASLYSVVISQISYLILFIVNNNIASTKHTKRLIGNNWDSGLYNFRVGTRSDARYFSE